MPSPFAKSNCQSQEFTLQRVFTMGKLKLELQTFTGWVKRKRSNSSAPCVIALSFLTLVSAFAEPKAKPSRQVRFLAVGDSPPFQQEIRGDVRYEIDPPAESIPPRDVVVGFGKELTDAVPLRLGRISPSVKVPAGEGLLALRRKEDAADTAPWLSFQRPESGDFLVFLFRNPAGKNWNEALSLTVPDGAEGAPSGSLRIVNLCPFGVRILWGSELIQLQGGKTLLKTAQPGAETPFQILIADAGGKPKRYYSGAVTQNSGERGLVTIYPADGESPRRPVKVSMLREPVPVAPPVKEKKD